MENRACTADELMSSMTAVQQAVATDGSRALMLDDFELGRTIGKGRYARVRLAKLKNANSVAPPICIKILKKKDMQRLEQLSHVVNEKDVLSSSKHPFIIQLLRTFQDEARLYMVLELVNGGELFTLLRSEKSFKLASARFYIAEMTSAITYLHEMLVVYRDIKPENVLVHRTGHLKLTDFGFAKLLRAGRTFTMCGTPAYMAPEILVGKHAHGLPVDWWALGVLSYELLSGRAPFDAAEEQDIFKQVLEGHPPYSAAMDSTAKDMIQRLLHPKPSSRLGGGTAGAEAVRGHAFFKPIDWADCDAGRLPPPWLPTLGADDDTTRFEQFQESTGAAEAVMPTDSFTASAFVTYFKSSTGENLEGWSERRDFRPEGLNLAAECRKARLRKEEEERKKKEEEDLRLNGGRRWSSNSNNSGKDPQKMAEKQACCTVQ